MHDLFDRKFTRSEENPGEIKDLSGSVSWAVVKDLLQGVSDHQKYNQTHIHNPNPWNWIKNKKLLTKNRYLRQILSKSLENPAGNPRYIAKFGPKQARFSPKLNRLKWAR